MGSVNAKVVSAVRRNSLRVEMCHYMDQHRWIAGLNLVSWAAVNDTRMNSRVRNIELEIIDYRMGRLRSTYIQIELAQAALGLSTVEGASYG